MRVAVAAGDVLDEVVLRSYAIGAAHQALGWVRSEGVAVDADGAVRDLTIRSFGILAARAMPAVEVVVEAIPGPAGGRRAMPFSPPWPPRRGWPTGSRRRGPPTSEVGA